MLLFSNKENNEAIDAERKRKLTRMKFVRSAERDDATRIRIGQKALVCACSLCAVFAAGVIASVNNIIDWWRYFVELTCSWMNLTAMFREWFWSCGCVITWLCSTSWAAFSSTISSCRVELAVLKEISRQNTRLLRFWFFSPNLIELFERCFVSLAPSGFCVSAGTTGACVEGARLANCSVVSRTHKGRAHHAGTHPGYHHPAHHSTASGSSRVRGAATAQSLPYSSNHYDWLWRTGA